MFRNILVAVDGSAPGDKAWHEALSLAAQQGARVTLLHVVDLDQAAARMEKATDALYEQHVKQLRRSGNVLLDTAATQAAALGLEARTLVIDTRLARAGDAIAAEASRGYDLVVVGTHGRRGWDRLLLGSDAERVVRKARCPVLLVRDLVAAGDGRRDLERVG